MAELGWYFYITKFIEFADTVSLIVLKVNAILMLFNAIILRVTIYFCKIYTLCNYVIWTSKKINLKIFFLGVYIYLQFLRCEML